MSAEHYHTEESMIIAIKQDPKLRYLMHDNKALLEYAKKHASWLNMETLARYRRKYRNSMTPTEKKWNNKIVTFPFEQVDIFDIAPRKKDCSQNCTCEKHYASRIL